LTIFQVFDGNVACESDDFAEKNFAKNIIIESCSFLPSFVVVMTSPSG